MKTICLFLLLPVFAFSRTKKYDPELNNLRWGPNVIHYDYQNAIFFYSTISSVKTSDVSSVSRYSVKKNGAKSLILTKVYNEKGYLIKEFNERMSTERFYNDTILTKVVRKSKKEEIITEYAYDDQNRMTGISTLKNKILVSKYNFEYSSGNNLSLAEHIILGKKPKSYRLVHTFDDSKTNKIKSAYFINNQLEKTWVFNCDDKGRLQNQKTHVEEDQVCKYVEERNDGSFIKFQRILENGKPYLEETLFSKDSVMLSHSRYLNDTTLIMKSTYSHNKNTYMNFSKKGKLKYTSETLFDDAHNQIESSYFKKNNRKKTIWNANYSDKNLIQELTYSSGRKQVFEYSFRSK